jgi:hypothetical protein
MAKFLKYDECPRCIANGRDRSGDNLAIYNDGSSHCFSCGFHRLPPHSSRFKLKERIPDDEKAVLPSDFTREIPPEGWKWLLQYGLPYSYWKPYTGYSPAHNRLVLTFGNPIRFSIGRSLEMDKTKEKRKWRFWGDGHKYVELIGTRTDLPIVLVEDLISAHKVGQVTQALCLFGTHIHDLALTLLIKEKRPVTLWLDDDQYTLLPAKVARLQTFLKHPVRWIRTEKDPKEYSVQQIKEYLT